MAMFASVPLPDVSEIRKRLELIFPEGIADRQYVVRETAAKIVFVMLYIDAIERRDIWLAPKHVYRMTDQQAARQSSREREQYRQKCMRPDYKPEGDRWYADNSREQVRDESIRDGLIPKGAISLNTSIPTNSNKGRYALREHFAGLFLLPKTRFEADALLWQRRYLSPGELGRIRIMRERQHAKGSVHVTLPNGETRIMAAGPSSLIAKAVIEEFAIRYLNEPAVLWISESGNKLVVQDDKLMRDLGLPIDQQRLLPDLVLADLGLEQVLLVFVEVVATDGPVTETRKRELLKLTEAAGYSQAQVAFISAFEQRNSPPLKRRFSGIAVNTLIWCMAEPDLLIWLNTDQELPLKFDKL